MTLRIFTVVLLLAAAAPAVAQTKAYVAHTAANVVTIIDTGSGAVVGTIPVGAPTHVAAAGDGTRVYVSRGAADAIDVIDTATDSVVATVPVRDNPSYLAVSPDRTSLYVMTAAGGIDVIDTASNSVTATIAVPSAGEIALTPDGARAYVAGGLVHVVDTASRTVVASFTPEATAIANVVNSAVSVRMAPDGTRAYIGATTFDYRNGFGAGGGVVVVDTATNTVTETIALGALPGSIALTPDGSRAYVGIESKFVNTGYGSGFFPGRTVAVIDVATSTIVGQIDLGADGSNWSQQNTADGIGVTPDRRNIYITVPRIGSVAVAPVNTNVVTTRLVVDPAPGALAIVPAPGTELVPYVVAAVDDIGNATTAGGTAVANVLANDTFGGTAARLSDVSLAQQSSDDGRVALDAVTGAVTVAPGTPPGTYGLVYRLCEIADVSNCDDATVTVTVREVYVIDAVDDAATSVPGRIGLANVLANDTLNGAPATTATVTLSQVSSTTTGLQLNVSTGSVFVYVGAAVGPQTLVYRICEKASPINCDQASVTMTVMPFAIDAVDDSGAAPRTGGTALGSVLLNDRFAGVVATTAKVRLSQISSTHTGVALTVTSGAVTVAAGTPVGTYTLQYRICEIASPTNCDEAAVLVTVKPAAISAVNDYARGSSKVPATILASVLANDRLAGVRATTATVSLAQISIAPANSQIRLNVADGSVAVAGATNSGVYSLVYEICEIASPGNCARATVRVELSGGF